MQRNTQRPKLAMHDANEFPIFGLPLSSYKENEQKLAGKANADMLWNYFVQSICSQKKKDEQLLMAQLIDKREEQLEIEQYLMSAWACGVKVEQHGSGQAFQEKVEEFRAVLKNHRRSSVVDGSASPTNLRLAANFNSAKRAGGNAQSRSPAKVGGKQRSPNRRLDSDVSVQAQSQKANQDLAFPRKSSRAGSRAGRRREVRSSSPGPQVAVKTGSMTMLEAARLNLRLAPAHSS